MAPTLAPLAWQMSRGGWIWGPLVLARTGLPTGNLSGRARHAMQAWERRTPWEERGPDGTPGTEPIDPADSRRRLTDLLDSDRITAHLGIEPLDPKHDRAMICGSPTVLADLRAVLDRRGFTPSPRIGTPGDYVFERAFVEH